MNLEGGSPSSCNFEVLGKLKSRLQIRGPWNLNIVYCIPLYLMISRLYQNNWMNDGRYPSSVLFLN